jgi:hypothetical protein
VPTIRYLSITDLAERLTAELPDRSEPVTVKVIQNWRRRYGPDRDRNAIQVVPPFPPPDAVIGDPSTARFQNPTVTVGWREASVPRIVEWHGKLPGRGKGPRPGRRKPPITR